SNRFIASTVAGLLFASLTAHAAQAPSPAQASPSTPAATTDAITVQGCIQPSVNAVSATPDAVAVGTSGSVSTATAYILASAVKPTGTHASTAGASAAVAPTYQLSAGGSKLTPHVCHKVKNTGKLGGPDRS